MMTEIWVASGWAVNRGSRIHKNSLTVIVENPGLLYVGEGRQLLANLHAEYTFLYGLLLFLYPESLLSAVLLSSFSQSR